MGERIYTTENSFYRTPPHCQVAPHVLHPHFVLRWSLFATRSYGPPIGVAASSSSDRGDGFERMDGHCVLFLTKITNPHLPTSQSTFLYFYGFQLRIKRVLLDSHGSIVKYRARRRKSNNYKAQNSLHSVDLDEQTSRN